MDDSQKAFIGIYRELAHTRSHWQVWSDMIELFACSISNAVDGRFREQREQRYLGIIGNYEKHEADLFPRLFAELVLALERNPFHDYLGKLFMHLELQSHWKGQFFTPDSVCQVMARLTMGNWHDEIEQRGWISIHDPACGAGAMLIAAAKHMSETRSDFQHRALFIGQDIDQTAGLMCYISLSLLGCAGYVKIGDSLSDPLTGNTLIGEQHDRMWFTPLYFSETWHWRRAWNALNGLMKEGTHQ